MGIDDSQEQKEKVEPIRGRMRNIKEKGKKMKKIRVRCIILTLLVAFAFVTQAYASQAGGTVTWHYNNGEEDAKTVIEADSRVFEPDAPQREGYIFSGWYSD